MAREKLITFFLKRRMMFCYHVNTFLTVILLAEKLPNKTPIFREKIVPKNAIFGPNPPPPPPLCPVQVFVRSQTNATVVSSEVLATRKVSIREGFV